MVSESDLDSENLVSTADSTQSPLVHNPENQENYRVLARKYRPTRFADLIGQESLVRILSNAFATGRIAHAFVLTGVRGVGKTTTARIIARALNCIGPDGMGGPTFTPCGVCESCMAIAGDRHIDVLEMDAASRTGVNDIREIIEGSRYRPAQARYRIYIIDEIHMLSNNAFNALLKTLEEPPPHVKFIFATTEIRKLPVTVLSRCQRFDLRRIEAEMLAAHFGRIAEQEGAVIEPAALRLITHAADGSVRDGLSLLDQAIAMTTGLITAEQTRLMIGLADRSLSFSLLEQTLTGQPAAAIGLLENLYRSGADPVTLLQDLMQMVHGLTRLKVTPDSLLDEMGLLASDFEQAQEMAQKLTLPALTRAWQMLLKGLQEVLIAPHPLQAVEMVLIRLAYIADLPDPAHLLRQIEAESMPKSKQFPAQNISKTPFSKTAYPQQTAGEPVTLSRSSVARAAPIPQTSSPLVPIAPATLLVSDTTEINDFGALVKLFETKREGILASLLTSSVRLVTFAPGRVTAHFDPPLFPDKINQITKLLSQWTGRHWEFHASVAPENTTLDEQMKQQQDNLQTKIQAHNLYQSVLQFFPKTVIVSVDLHPVRQNIQQNPLPELKKMPERDVLLDFPGLPDNSGLMESSEDSEWRSEFEDIQEVTNRTEDMRSQKKETLQEISDEAFDGMIEGRNIAQAMRVG